MAEKIDELTKEKEDYLSKMAVLAFDLSNLKRMIFGAQKERFKPVTADVHQLSLFEDEPQAQPEEQPKLERITYEREKSKKKHPWRNPILVSHCCTAARAATVKVYRLNGAGGSHAGAQVCRTHALLPAGGRFQAQSSVGFV